MDDFERFIQKLIEKNPDRFREPGNPLDHCADLPTTEKEMLQAYREGRIDDVAAYAMWLKMGDPLEILAKTERLAKIKKAALISKQNREMDARDRKREAREMLAEMPIKTTKKDAAKQIHREWAIDAEQLEHTGAPTPFVPKIETIRGYLKGARKD